MNKKHVFIAVLAGLALGLYAHKIPVVSGLAKRLPGRETVI